MSLDYVVYEENYFKERLNVENIVEAHKHETNSEVRRHMEREYARALNASFVWFNKYQVAVKKLQMYNERCGFQYD